MISDDLKLQLIGIKTRAELNECYDILKHVSHTLTQNEKSAFNVGDEVYWMSNKKGGKRVDGVITKVMKKNVKVRVGYSTWTVHPSFLHHADEEDEEPTFNVLTGEFE